MTTQLADDNNMSDILAKMPDPRVTQFKELWDGHISEILLGTEHISAAGIFSLESGELVGKSTNFHMRPEEYTKLAEDFDDLDQLYRHGVTINQVNYNVRLADGRFGIFARTALKGCTVCRTFNLLIVGVHDEKGKPAKCNDIVMALGDYFFRKGL